MPATTAATITLTCPRPDHALVTLGGELDLAALERLCAIFARASNCTEIVVDVAGVGFIDCCALRPLLTAARAAAATGGRLVLREPSPAVVALVAWCGLEADLPTSSAPRRRRRADPAGRQVTVAA